MYFYKMVLAILVLGNSCLANPEIYIVARHPHHQNYSHQQYQNPSMGQSILAGIASNTIPGVAAENAFTGRVVKSASQIHPEFPNIIDIKKRVECLSKLFDCPKNIFTEIKDVQHLTFNFEHIFGIEIVEMYKNGILKKFGLSGFHHDYMGSLESGGVYVKEITRTGIAGAYEARINIGGMTFKPKTFFPQNWNDEKVVQKILQSFENLSFSPELQTNGKWSFVGKTAESLKIQTIIDQLGNIITSYPIIE